MEQSIPKKESMRLCIRNLKLSREDQLLDIESFRQDQLSEALQKYGDLEDRIEAVTGSGCLGSMSGRNCPRERLRSL